MNHRDALVSNHYQHRPEGEGSSQTKEDIMKTIVSALIALAVLAGVAAPASAVLDAKKFWDQQTRQGR